MRKGIVLGFVGVVVVTVPSAFVVGRYENRVSPEFHAQLAILNAAIKEQQNDETERMRVANTEEELKTDQLRVHNDNLRIQIAELEGRPPDYAALGRDEKLVAVDEASEHFYEQIKSLGGDVYPSPDVVLSGLSTHAKTIRDRYLLHRLHESNELSDEARACYSLHPFDPSKPPDKSCQQLEQRADLIFQYVSDVGK